MRTFSLLGVHPLVAVTAVTVQNSLGVKGFHEIPVDVIAGQIDAVATDIGLHAAKTGMLASSQIIETVAHSWRTLGLAGTVPFVVDPVCASMHGDPLLHDNALETLRTVLFLLASLVTPNLDEVRLLVGIEVVDAATQRDAARALHDLGPQWALVKVATCARPRTARICFTTARTSTPSMPRGWTPATTTGPGTPWRRPCACPGPRL